MSIGKNIKVVLTLDDSGFSQKVVRSKEAVKSLEVGLTEFGKSADRIETSISGLGKNVDVFSKSFGGIQKSLDGLVDKLQQVATKGFGALDKAQKESVNVAKSAATAFIDAKLNTLKNEVETNKKLINDRARLHSELRKLENDERAKSTGAMMRAEGAEARLGAYGGKNIVSANLNEADRHERTANAIKKEIDATNALIIATRQEQIARGNEIASLEVERVALISAATEKERLGKIANAVGKNNAAEVSRIVKAARLERVASEKEERQAAGDFVKYKKILQTEEVRSNIAAQVQIRNTVRETTAIQKAEARQVAQNARDQANSIAQMWKGMAQAYSGAKIEQGLMSSVKTSDDYSRVLERLDAMGLEGAQGKTNTLNIAKQVELANPNISKTDALKMTLATTAGAVSTDPNIVGRIVPEIAKMTTVMTRLFPEQAHNIEQYTQNMMGVMESRGIAKDPEKMIATLDNLARALVLTQGKLSIQDYETIGRRGGNGNAQLKNDESILYDIAAASQLKVAGGAGGGAGGVSTFATMQRQASKGAQGGVLERRSALENQVEFGIIDKDELLAANGNKPLGKNAKAVSYVGANEASDNMTKFAMKLVNEVKTKLAALPESDTRFFAKGVDRTDDKQQAKAFGRFADQTWSNTNRAEFYKQFATKGSQERIDTEVDGAKAAPSYSKVHEESMKSWGVSVDKTKAALVGLGVTIGDILIPILQPCLDLVTRMIDSFRRFAENQKVAATLTAIAAGFGGAVLSIKGFMSMFGEAGLLGVMRSFIGLGPSVATVISAPVEVTAWMALKSVFADLAGWLGSLVLKIPLLGAAILKIGSAFGISGGFLQSFGKIFKGLAAVLLAWDVGYMVGTWASDFKVGTLTIGEHFQNMLLKLDVGWKKLWIDAQVSYAKFRNFMHIDSDAETKVRLDGLAAEEKALVNFNKTMKITVSLKQDEKKEAPKPKAATKKGKKADLSKDDPDEEGSPKDAGTTGTKGLFKEKPDAERHADPLTKALEETRGKVSADKIKMQSILTDAEGLAALTAEVTAELEGKRLAGDYNNDQKNPVQSNAKEFQDLIKLTVEKRTLENQTKALDFANQQVAQTTIEADAAMTRLADGGAAQASDAFRALERELASSEKRLHLGAAGFDAWNKAKSKALFGRASADAANYAADLSEKNLKGRADLLPTEQARKEEEIRLVNEAEGKKYQITVDNLKKTKDARIAALANEFILNEEFSQKALAVNDEYDDKARAIKDAHSQYLALKGEVDAHALRSPMDAMVEQWQDSFKSMQDAQVSWSNSFVSMITSSMSTGKLEVGGFIKSVLMSLLDAQLKAQLAQPLNSIMGGIGQFAMNMFGAMSPGAGAGSSAGAFSLSSGGPTNFSVMPHAMGGMMVDGRSVELRKYANGGIANSPQLAMYGEAGPEAYVPLPDGRSIPVTMKGGGQGASQAPVVTVNVINQTGQQATAQQGQVRFDGKQFILDVVMSAASQPGGFRSGMKEAMR